MLKYPCRRHLGHWGGHNQTKVLRENSKTSGRRRPGRNRPHHRDSLAKSSGSHSSSPRVHPYRLFHFHARNAYYSQGKDNCEPWQHHNKLRMGCVSDSRGTQPSLALDRDGGELAHSRDPGFVAAVFLGVYRQASRYVVFRYFLAYHDMLTIQVLTRYRWRYVSRLRPFAYDIPQRRHEASREGTIVPYPDGKRSSASSFP